MKLRRKWPAICIFCIFLLFDVVMIASCSYFSGLFPSENIMWYVGGFTVLSVLIMGVLTFLLGRVCDMLNVEELSRKTGFKILYGILLAGIVIGSVYYRVDMLARNTGIPTGKLSLYDNAIVHGVKIQESDLLSVIYSKLLGFVLLFTGNKISVAFFFEVFLFTVFIICGAFAVRMLLGKTASLVFAAYTSFMPLFSDNIRNLKLSTEYLFLALFGIELLFVAFYLKGIAKKAYSSGLWVIWYLIVGVVVGFMTYADAGTFIMILPLLLAALFIHDSELKKEIGRLLFVLLGAVLTFGGMIIQEAGFMQADVTLAKWASYYFHNLNTFSMFWTYTDYKVIYLITLVAMSGVIVGFWRNKVVEQVSPWLLSLLIVFATVPFMGATRMNDQMLVTIYYAFILACVAALICLSSDRVLRNAEDTEDIEEYEEEEIPASEQSGIAHVVEPDNAPEPKPEPKPEPEPKTEPKPEPKPEPKKNEPRFVPEGMVVPVDDDDETPREREPRMKMPKFEGTISLNRKEINDALKAEEAKKRAKKRQERRNAAAERKDDFDIAFKEGDDFDI